MILSEKLFPLDPLQNDKILQEEMSRQMEEKFSRVVYSVTLLVETIQASSNNRVRQSEDMAVISGLRHQKALLPAPFRERRRRPAPIDQRQ
ncbi:hypothetical protein B1A99_30930 [Cohnella sp. CIP 111063]|nr:hypothetical protein B1A99_30930 [Cohnella sp. CIP 111063]